MEKLKKILEAEIAQRELALKHNPLNKVEISEELNELKQGLVKLFPVPDAEKTYILQKDLPNCPRGRKFIPNIDGDYFLSMTDEEYIDGKLKRYNFTKNEVELNPDWFLLITA